MSIYTDIRTRIKLSGKGGANVSVDEIAGLDKEIDVIITNIRKSSNVAVAVVQGLLALLLFKYDAPLSSKQKALVRQFDRNDDPFVRKMVIDAIKDGTFPEKSDFIC